MYRGDYVSEGGLCNQGGLCIWGRGIMYPGEGDYVSGGGGLCTEFLCKGVGEGYLFHLTVFQTHKMFLCIGAQSYTVPNKWLSKSDDGFEPEVRVNYVHLPHPFL